jgi:hydroxymethylpyrimidine pyrophosphatase-like HAD family hydrolase
MINFLETAVPDLIIPTWKIEESEQPLYAKVLLDSSNRPIAYYEKELIPLSPEYSIMGLLGCYFIKDITILKEFSTYANISDILQILQKSHSLEFVRIEHAGFFGTPESLIKYRFTLAKKMTFFVDIDGTILYLPKHVSYESTDSHVLPGTREKLLQWKNEGHTIVLTTGRVTARREKLEKQLKELDIPYDQLVTNLRPGPRILINDKKPYSDIHQMAKAIQLKRNVGFGSLNIEETADIVQKLKGGSFASVYLIKKNNTLLVRKYIDKTKETEIHYDTLKRQYDDLKRFEYYSPNITPKMLGSYENENDFYYDMEYLKDYNELNHYSSDTIKTVVRDVMDKMTKDIYCYSKKINGAEWLQAFLKEKIYSKYKYLDSLDEHIYSVMNSETITINGKNVSGIKSFFNSSIPSDLLPDEVSPIHGDLTLENILYNETNKDFRLIDTSGSRYVDVKEMDLAKLLQSLLSKYETWDSRETLVTVINSKEFTISSDFLKTEKENYDFIFSMYGSGDVMFKRAKFFLAAYFIRMIPFLEKRSSQHSLLGLLLASYYFSTTT